MHHIICPHALKMPPGLCQLCFENQGHGHHYVQSCITWVAGGNNALREGQTDHSNGLSLQRRENGPPKAWSSQMALSGYSNLSHQPEAKGQSPKDLHSVVLGTGGGLCLPYSVMSQLTSSQRNSRETQC